MWSTEPLDIVATHILPLVTIYVCRLRGRGKMRVSANRPSPSRVLTFFSRLYKEARGIFGEPKARTKRGGTQKKRLGRTRQRTAWPQASSRERRTGGSKFFFRRWDPPFKSAFFRLYVYRTNYGRFVVGAFFAPKAFFARRVFVDFAQALGGGLFA